MSHSHALCEQVEGRTYRVVETGSKRKMVSARRAAKREYPGKNHRVFLIVSQQVGDLIR